ncbi:amidohydrolase family protein [Teichococcus vastitatis]|uniref:Amidohydrolase family protein n=1 Tax=Teichococcus vastitatis TaxID=2307076 RepID=A0ABS9W1Z2_9PROT|nr:amidohydrolase family protein [Pseudoroseomonas vastitatis]MCI0753068.1 amidohydrolase family protein [Pseudoroseomonas vastitatis]
MNEPVPDCPAPLPRIRTPRFIAPPGACDCHFHVFGPYREFPLQGDRSYTPPEASLDRFRAVMRTLRLQRCVIVQPSVYGLDHSCLLDALERLGSREARGVAASGCDAPDRNTIVAWHRAGIRGLRLNLVSGRGPDVAALRNFAACLADHGWHLQVFLPRPVFVEAVPLLLQLPVPVVVDHLGDLDPGQGRDDPVFRGILRLLDKGHGWVKLIGYRSSQRDAPFPDLIPLIGELARLRPDRLLWGSNWPHPLRDRKMPDDGDLLDALSTWLADTSLLSRVLVENPRNLYGFEHC